MLDPGAGKTRRSYIWAYARGELDAQREGIRIRFDTAYVLPNSLKSALLPLLAGIPRRVGYLGESRVGLLTRIGILANGAGLTMTTMDAVSLCGGAPANFLEIGGEAYTKAHIALEILLSSPNIRSVLVNFCGAFNACRICFSPL